MSAGTIEEPIGTDVVKMRELTTILTYQLARFEAIAPKENDADRIGSAAA